MPAGQKGWSHMAKKVKLIFKTEGNGTMEVSIADPKEGLTLAEATAAAAKMIPVFVTNAGAAAVELKSAVIVNTEETELV